MKVIYLRIILFITNTINKTLCYNICERFCFCLTFEDYSKLDFAPSQSLRKKKKLSASQCTDEMVQSEGCKI